MTTIELVIFACVAFACFVFGWIIGVYIVWRKQMRASDVEDRHILDEQIAYGDVPLVPR